MKNIKFKQLLFVVVISLPFLTGCGNDDKVTKQDNTSKIKKTIEVIKQDNSLQGKLNRLLEYKGKECPSPVTHLSIDSVSYDADSSSHTTKVNNHTNVYSNGNGSYTTNTYTTGGNSVTTYNGVTIYVEIKNDSDSSIDAFLSIKAKRKSHQSLFGFFGGYYEGTPLDIKEKIHVPTGGMKFSKYYAFSDAYIYDGPYAKLYAQNTTDDTLFINAKTIKNYHDYLQKDGCHYHLEEAKKKIRELLAKKTLTEALLLKDHEKQIVALEKYLEVFKDDRRAKKILDRDKKMLELLKKTEGNSVIVWEHGNPLLYSFHNVLTNTKHAGNLLFFIDDYLKAAEKNYKKEISFRKKQIPVEPHLEDFGKEPSKKGYPIKPRPTKGEFEKQKDFELRKNKFLEQWKQEVHAIDTQYVEDMQKYKKTQKELYDKAYSRWLQEKKNIEASNKKLEDKYNKNISLEGTYTDYWIWQAVVVSMGLEDFKFKKLQYNSEKELFEYIIAGGVLNFRFEGTIAIPITQAKEFKEYVKSNLSIVFKIEDNQLYIDDFIYKEKPSGYDATSKTKLVLVNEKQLKIERKKVFDAIAAAKKILFDKNYNNLLYIDADNKELFINRSSCVSLKSNVLILKQCNTDNGPKATLALNEINLNLPITIERDVYLHPEYSRTYKGGKIFFTGALGLKQNNESLFNIAYYKYDYKCKCHYFWINNKKNRVKAIWNKWFHEKIVYYPSTGAVFYYINKKLKLKLKAKVISKPDGLKFYMHTYGWWTGHYTKVRNLKINQLELKNIEKSKKSQYKKITEKRHFSTKSIAASKTINKKSYKVPASCFACHGVQFEKRALGKSKIVKNMTDKEIGKALYMYKNNKNYGGSLRSVMKGQVAKYSNKELFHIAKGIKQLKDKGYQ